MRGIILVNTTSLLTCNPFIQILGVAADVASYNILLKACCLAGRVDLAQDIYKEVQHVASTGALKMDIITYSTTIKVFPEDM